MSDYFGALLRAAGAAAASPAVPAAAAGVAAGGDIVEQAIEDEAGVPGERVAPPAKPPHGPGPEPAARSAEAAADDRRTRPAYALSAPAPAAPLTATPEARAAASPATQPAPPPPRRDDPALAHPVVQAALRWVAADPQAVPAADPLSANGDGLPRATIRPGAEDRLAPARAPAGPRPAIVDPGGSAKPARAAPEIDLTLPVVPRPRARSASERAETREAAATARPIDVHIGTIHVAVDAPPRAAVQPVIAPAPPRPEPPPSSAAARSGFARLRLPRL